VLPEEISENEPRRRVLVLTYEGEIAAAVEALKTHPAGHAATFGSCAKGLGDVSGAARKLHDRVILATYSFDKMEGLASVHYTDERNQYWMQFRLQHGSKNGARQNCRLTWLRYEFASKTVPQDGHGYDLRKEQHFAPYAFARVKPLEHLF